jgi:hypothetical protein
MPKARPARELLESARTAATNGNRSILVAFHASWCPWCRRLEATLARPAMKEIMDRHFVTLWLTVRERGAMKELENPGAADLYMEWAGGDAKAGLPFCAALDGRGALRGTSIRPLAPGARAENLGYPGSPDEIKAFLGLLKEGAPSLSDPERDILRDELEAARPRP